MKQILIVSGWLVGMSLTLFVSILSLNTLTRTQELPALILSQLTTGTDTNKLLTVSNFSGAVKGISTAVQTGDARPILIAQFLEENNSPLSPYDYWGDYLVYVADKYNLDYRLLPAIAMQESTLCKFIPPDSHNCLGLGVHSQGTWEFPSYEANFDKAAEILRTNYLDEGLITPEEIQDKYTPLSQGSWQKAVSKFMYQLETAEF